MTWLLSPSGWPVFADTDDEQTDLVARGYDAIAEASVPAAIAAFQAAESSPPSTQLPGWALAADVATALALKANASSLPAKLSIADISNPATAGGLALRAAFGSVADTLSLRRLTDLAAAGWSKSAARSRVDYEDAADFTEAWANLTAWTATNVQVSGGKLYAGASSTGAARSFPIPSGGTARIRTSIIVTTGTGAGGLIMVGLGKQAAGGAVAGADMLAMGLREDVTPYMWEGGVGGTNGAIGPAMATGTWWLTVTVDEANISFVLTNATGTVEYQRTYARSAFPTINNVVIWNNDSRALTGHAIGPVGAKAATVTVKTRTGVEGSALSVSWLPDANAQKIRVALPPAYDSRKPIPFVLYCHGSGDVETGPVTDSALNSVQASLLGAGYGVASSNQHGLNWGNQAGVDDIVTLYKYLRDHYAVGPVLLLGASMGGASSLLSVAQRALPGIAGWAGIFPVTDLADMYGRASYTAPITTAYGISGDYAAKTAGHDPNLLTGAAFRGVPMRFYASPSDVTVPKAIHSDVFAAKVAPYAPEATVVVASGVHGDNSHYQPSDVLAFFNRCIGV